MKTTKPKPKTTKLMSVKSNVQAGGSATWSTGGLPYYTGPGFSGSGGG